MLESEHASQEAGTEGKTGFRKRGTREENLRWTVVKREIIRDNLGAPFRTIRLGAWRKELREEALQRLMRSTGDNVPISKKHGRLERKRGLLCHRIEKGGCLTRVSEERRR